MKWNCWINPKPRNMTPSDTCEADSHEEALEIFESRFSVDRDQMTVEPREEAGKCHDNRYYSQSGPVLTEDEL